MWLLFETGARGKNVIIVITIIRRMKGSMTTKKKRQRWIETKRERERNKNRKIVK